jgi:ubiquinone/menaquinone biosynthesis C-methylase UbiE
MFTPARRRGVEILDDPSVDADTRERSTGDIISANRWLGGMRASMLAFRAVLPSLAPNSMVLDVGTGLADIPARAGELARRAENPVATIGVDRAPTLLSTSRDRVTHVVCADALALPFRDASVDVVMCSQTLHHFEAKDAERLLRELNRVARRAVIVSDLRRSWIAAAGFWIVAVALRFHRVTRHDGVLSVLRGFTPDELRQLVVNATGAIPAVDRRLGFRLTARWTRR